MAGILLLVFAWLALPALAQTNNQSARQPFVHPGLLQSREQLEIAKNRVAAGTEPWKGGFEKLKNDRYSQANWKLRGPFESVVRSPLGSTHIAEMDADANAAYQNALMWCLTGKEDHARKSVEILNAWAGKLKSISGKDKELGASLGGFKFVNAAELMRHTYPAWGAQNAGNFARMLTNVFLPVINNFATFANGNWDAGCIKTMIAIGVYCDDPALFRRGTDYYLNGEGNGSLTHYVVNPEGQCQESGRDQQHTQLGLGHLAEACEVAWHQGVDLYGANDNRLLAGFEYTARYNLDQPVPFVAWKDVTGKYRAKAISSDGRNKLRPIYEMVWNHYERRKGLKAPFTRQAADKLRPEGSAWSADHPGFGTVMFTLPSP